MPHRGGWSQGELAARAGISRAGVSSIETDRLVPSTSTALALATALDCRVEDLFQLHPAASESAWAWPPHREPSRYWLASVAGRELMYPTEPTNLGVIGHDGVCQEGQFRTQLTAAPSDTLVVASCDPAIGLLANELSRRSGFRLLAFPRSSQRSPRPCWRKSWCTWRVSIWPRRPPGAKYRGRQGAVAGRLLLAARARWQEGLALTPGLQLHSVRAAVQSRARWVGRESGSAARELLDELLADRRPPRQIAYGHRGVAEAIRCGWADIGVCLRLVSEEAGLGFLSVREEEYDFCYPAELEGDPRIQALIETVRSASYRGMLSDLPGYDAAKTGELERIV